MTTEHVIRLSIVRGVLSARTISPNVRWSALTAHVDTGSCGTSWRHTRLYRENYLGLGPMRLPSTMSTFHGGDVLLSVKKVRTLHGKREVKRIWGKGYRDMLAELQPKWSEVHHA